MSECSVVREQMPLLLVEALAPAAREHAHSHIESCAVCAREWADTRETWSTMAQLPELPVPDRLRARFRSHLDSLQPERAASNVVPFPGRRAVRWFAQAAAVVVLVGGGYIAGSQKPVSFVSEPATIASVQPATMRLAESMVLPASQVSSSIEGNPNIANVRFIEPETSGAPVGLSFDMTSRVTVTGQPNDKSLVNLIAYVVQNRTSSSTSRSSAIEWVKNNYTAGTSAEPEIVLALADVLRNDTHEGVRIKAVETLRSLPASLAPDARVALVEALNNDPNPSVRIKAIEALADLAGAENGIDAATVDTLRQKAGQDDENPYVRVKAAEALGQINL